MSGFFRRRQHKSEQDIFGHLVGQLGPNVMQRILSWFQYKFYKNLLTQGSTHMGAAHAISKIEQKFQNRIPRELDKNFDSPRISSNFFEIKKSPT